jgi:AraC family transcriptional regulator
VPPRYDPVSYGSPRFRTVEHGGFLVTDAWFPAGATLPGHFHERTVVATTIGGRWDSVLGGRAYVSTPGMVLTEPAGERHANHFSGQGGRVVIVQPDSAREEMLRPFARWLGRPNLLEQPRVAMLARRLSIETRHGDNLSPLIIEALSLEMLATAARARHDRCAIEAGSAPVWLHRVIEYLHAAFLGPVRICNLASVAGVHPAHIARAFRKWQRVSPGAYVRRLRLEWAADQLAASDISIAAIAAQAGYADQSHFTRSFRTCHGVPPGVFRARLRTAPRR